MEDGIENLESVLKRMISNRSGLDILRALLGASFFALTITAIFVVQKSLILDARESVLIAFWLGVWDGQWAWWLGIFSIVIIILKPNFHGMLVRFELLGRRRQGALIVVFFGILVAIDSPYTASAFTVILLGFLLFKWPLQKRRHIPEDRLYRRYFAERVVDSILKSVNPMKRVAILGPWGQGKTRILELIQHEIEKLSSKDTYRVATVNPWQAATPNEAWAILADGFDAALGFEKRSARMFTSRPLTRLLLKMLPTFTTEVSELAFEAFTQADDGYEDKIQEIEHFLKSRRIRLVLLVDDMERAEPAVIRSMFPVIDRLCRFESCTFVFAIDVDRIKKAFGNDDRGCEEAKGYLDKVFDLQIDLPDISQSEAARLVLSQIDSATYPRLSESMPAIVELLPLNPRQIGHFLTRAKSKEMMWLVRYGLNERAYIKFFILQLMETEFTGIGELLIKFEKEIRAVCLEANAEFSSRKDIASTEKYQKLSEDLGDELRLDPGKRVRFSFLLAHFMGYLRPESSLEMEDDDEMQWIVHGHAKLLYLTTEECRKVSERFSKETGTKSLAVILRSALGRDDFSKLKACLSQVLESEVQTVTKSLYKLMITENDAEIVFLRESAVAVLERLRIHHRWALQVKSSVDLLLFGDEYFDLLLRFFGLNSVKYLADERAGPIREKLVQCALQAVPGLSFSKAVELSFNNYEQSIYAVFDQRGMVAIESDIARIREENVSRIHKIVADLFGSESLFQQLESLWRGITYRDFFCSSPRCWLGDGMKAQERLCILAKQADQNEVVRRNFILIVENVFLSPFNSTIPEVASYRVPIIALIRSERWFVISMWKIVSGKYDEPFAKLIQKRMQIISILEGQKNLTGPGSISVDEFVAAFPLSAS